jgi:hypothetical protein
MLTDVNCKRQYYFRTINLDHSVLTILGLKYLILLILTMQQETKFREKITVCLEILNPHQIMLSC